MTLGQVSSSLGTTNMTLGQSNETLDADRTTLGPSSGSLDAADIVLGAGKSPPGPAKRATIIFNGIHPADIIGMFSGFEDVFNAHLAKDIFSTSI
ncbi:MAG TPA: hypothetical protein DEG28_10790 [Porphyromonadaceae bacterium]|nr:hypothetical protein [Porphyromonadaceae bacterium]HBX46353.1 hypothetical protein [Porphyromonadaceae bacterium]